MGMAVMGSHWQRDGAIIAVGKIHTWDFPGGPVVKTALSVQGSKVRPLVGKLRSHMLLQLGQKIN